MLAKEIIEHKYRQTGLRFHHLPNVKSLKFCALQQEKLKEMLEWSKSSIL